MIEENYLPKKEIADYKKFLSGKRFTQLLKNIQALKGKRIIHINSTPKGGGVSELLKSLIPLEKDLGLDLHWFSLKEDAEFFRITKKLHNSLQGSDIKLSKKDKDYYIKFNKRLANCIEALNPDILIIHDPQPLAMVNFLRDIPVISRIHIDLTNPNKDSIVFLETFLKKCQIVVFSLREFVPEELLKAGALRMAISPPGIDPLSDKNRQLSSHKIKSILTKTGLLTKEPLLAQVSRFDPWKDPIGIIKAYRIVKKHFPSVKLILAGITEAQDDPEAREVLNEVRKESGKDKDIFIFSEINQLKGVPVDFFINTIQEHADVIFQKSIKEGFGLTVSEAMWKRKAVVGGDVGGIKLQIKNGVNGFLVNGFEEAAQKALFLLQNKKIARNMGIKARKSIKNDFLITRMIEDEINIMRKIAT